MKYVIDIETDSLTNVKNIWVVVIKCIETGEYQYFRNILRKENYDERERLVRFLGDLRQERDLLIGHNLIGFDCPIVVSALELHPEVLYPVCLDTLIVSKLIDYSRNGHSIEDYGLEFGFEKGKHSDFSKYSQEMEEYCVRDVDICERIYNKYLKYISNTNHQASIQLEHQFQLVVNSLHDNGFGFNSDKAVKLLIKVESELNELDGKITEAFPPRLRLIREITPKETKYGTLNRTDFRFLGSDVDLTEYNGGPFSRCSWQPFNASSHKQIISVLRDAGWSPVDKTSSHILAERLVHQLKYRRGEGLDIQREAAYNRLQELRITGWKVNENNIETLPAKAPQAARLLAKRILLEARRRTLTEWLNLIWFEIEIEHAQLGTLGINGNGKLIQSLELKTERRKSDGATIIQKSQEQVTERDTSNFNTDCHSKTLLEWLKRNKVNAQSVKENASSTSIIVIGREQLESFSVAAATATLDGLKNSPLRYKVISERIHGKFNGLGAWSHRMNHQNPNTANIPNEYDTAGKKKLLGKELRSLWCAPKNRLLVGCDAEGIQLRIFAHLINEPEFTNALVEGKKEDKTDPHSLNQRILGDVCKSRAAAKRFIYALLLGAGLGKLAEILGCSESAAREALNRLLERYSGWARLREEVFPLDARRGWFIGLDGRKVRIPSDGESGRRHLAMSGYLQNGEAVCMKLATLKFFYLLPNYDAKLVNFVHDEWQVECPNNMKMAVEIGQLMADSLVEVGKDLKLNCPLAGSFYNDDAKDYTIANNWAYTH